MDFAIRLVNYVLNLPDRRVNSFWRGNSNYCKTVIGPTRSTRASGPALQIFFRLVEMTAELVHASYSLASNRGRLSLRLVKPSEKCHFFPKIQLTFIPTENYVLFFSVVSEI